MMLALSGIWGAIMLPAVQTLGTVTLLGLLGLFGCVTVLGEGGTIRRKPGRRSRLGRALSPRRARANVNSWNPRFAIDCSCWLPACSSPPEAPPLRHPVSQVGKWPVSAPEWRRGGCSPRSPAPAADG